MFNKWITKYKHIYGRMQFVTVDGCHLGPAHDINTYICSGSELIYYITWIDKIGQYNESKHTEIYTYTNLHRIVLKNYDHRWLEFIPFFGL